MAHTANAAGPRVPMLWAVAPLAVGIIIGRYFAMPWWAVAFCLVVSLSMAWIVVGRGVGNVYVAMTIFFAGILLTHLNRPEQVLPVGRKVEMRLRLTEEPVVMGRWQRANAELLAYSDGGKWVAARENITVYIDTCYRIGAFRTMECCAYVNPINTTDGSYRRMMAARGYFNRIYLTPGAVSVIDPKPVKTLRYYAVRIQAAAVERMSHLNIPGREADVVCAMVAGDRRNFDRGLRDSYAITGATHLLAVSGLNVGIVFIVVNLLLMPVTLLPRGHIWKNGIAIPFIFGYAVMSGLSPPVIRAALTFSFAQVALAMSSVRNAFNLALASAFVLLVIDPYYLFDVSFQLSYAAILSIMMFYGPLYRLVKTRYGLINTLSGVTIVGLAAGAGTAPMVAYYFGNFPLVGILLNPVVILTANAIVIAGIIWVIAPIPFLRPIIAWVAGKAALIQNTVIDWGAGFGWAGLNVEMPLWGVFVCYAVLIVSAIWYYMIRQAGN